MIQLSKRLQSVADFVENCETMADVGTDHGYIPIYLVLNRKVKKAIAMDVNPGPLQRAKEHICQYGLEHAIETRLSDGCFALKPGEADAIVIAGMGGALMQRILEQGEAAAKAAQRLVLQPQSEAALFRQFLFRHGYQILAEDMALEDGKYYPIIAAQYMGWENNATALRSGREKQDSPIIAAQYMGWETDATALRSGREKQDSPIIAAQYMGWENNATALRSGRENQDGFRIACKFGPLLLAQRHPTLKKYLICQQRQKRKILENLKENARQDASERIQEIKIQLKDIEAALEIVGRETGRRQSYDLP